MLSFIKKYFDYNERQLNDTRSTVAEINKLEEDVRHLKDSDFLKETEKLKKQVQSGVKTLDEVLPWSYALVREAARRTLNQRYFDVQMIAAVGLHQGKVVEQKTGEGKTLTATAALYLNALEGKGAHLVTVNDYLARRDAGWMGEVFNFLGLKTSAIISSESFLFDPKYSDKDAFASRLSHLKPVSRADAYAADVTYGINSEFGFDYLRDNMAHSPVHLVQRGFHYAIVDEADSVLIDEARTPHIISAPYEEDVSKYYGYAKIVNQLKDVDYVVDEKLRTAHLTEKGITHIESMLDVSNVYEKDFETLYHVEAALKANTLFKNNKDYIIRGDEVVIVDEFTGRLLEGRRFSEGLHQAIEAKENVSIKQESRTLATVSLQNYFRGYKKLAGMTGTAATEAEELNKIYKTEVLVVPTHRPMIRRDNADFIYKTEKAKFNAVVETIVNQYKAGRPVLVGTTSIEKNEHLSHILKTKGIPHELLNAKNHEREAHIIAQAGKKHAVTVATNMAGRGVDIVLGGDLQRSLFKTDKEYEKAKKEWKKEHDEIISLGGLYVIGTERHESRRIDNQLRGRSGRQGDPGETQFFVSLEDNLMRVFASDTIKNMMGRFGIPEDEPIKNRIITSSLEKAQERIEGFNFDARKHVLEFDDVLNFQRKVVYGRRRKLLMGEKSDLESYLETIVAEASEEEKTAILAKLDEIGRDKFLEALRIVALQANDMFWVDHLEMMDYLRGSVNLRAYGQRDPLVEYKKEGMHLFKEMEGGVIDEIIRILPRVNVNVSGAETAELKE